MQNVLMAIGIIGLIMVGAIGLLIGFNSKPLTKAQARSAIRKLIEKEVSKHPTVSSGLVYIESKTYGVSAYFAEGIEHKAHVQVDQPFHVASVGKAFTATLIGVLIEAELLDMNDPISHYLKEDVLEGLFVYEGIDYQDKVTIRHLLNHTSGIADYFEGETIGSKSMTELVINDPDRFFTPKELIEFTRNYQEAVGRPGEQYLYSDTGYILLGLVIEAVSGKAFHECLNDAIFEPLKMDDTYLMFYSRPKNPRGEIADIWLNGVQINDYKSLSVDWAGGGLISTLKDLASFVKALNSEEVITKDTLDQLYQFDQKFMRGIYYGNGFMEYHFGEFFPTLKSMPKFKGHMGILGTQMFYDEETETTYISSFGSTDYSDGSVRTMIKVIGTVSRIKE